MRLLLSGGKATLSAGDSSSEGRRAAMRMFAGLDVGFKRTAVCVVDEAGRIVWRGVVDTHPEALCRALQRWGGKLAKIGLESGSMTPWLARELAKAGFPVVCMDARAAADAVKSRRVKSDKADAYALAEMLRTGWYRAVYVKSEDSHRLKAMLGARDQLVRAKRALGNQVRGPTDQRSGLPPVRLVPSIRAGQKTSPQLRGTASSIQRSPYMSLRADRYRQRADDAKHRAAQAKDPSIKSAFEHVTAVWAALADQVERIGFLHATKKTITQSAICHGAKRVCMRHDQQH